jgi:hypothetical protein
MNEEEEKFLDFLERCKEEFDKAIAFIELQRLAQEKS